MDRTEKQTYSSAGTSINKKRLPAIFNKVHFAKGSSVLDFGCGRYIDHIQKKVNDQGCTYYPYDPYNLPGSELPENKCDYGVCSNVLNVIDNKVVIKSIINELVGKVNNTIYFIVYEGDGSRIGRVTGKDCYQRNEKISDYVKMMKDMGYDPIVKGRVIQISL